MPKNTYLLKDGTPVPGTTTICNQLDKPQLVNWAWKLGLEGKDWKEARDSAGDIGTLVHELIMKFLCGDDIKIIGEGSPPIVQDCFDKFLQWWRTMAGDLNLTLILIEKPLVSEKLKFGGQPDIYIEEKQKLLDIKTGGGIYESYWLQLAAYGILLRENGYEVKVSQILWLPKDGRFGCPIRTDLRKEKKIFKNLLEIYRLRKEIEH